MQVNAWTITCEGLILKKSSSAVALPDEIKRILLTFLYTDSKDASITLPLDAASLKCLDKVKDA